MQWLYKHPIEAILVLLGYFLSNFSENPNSFSGVIRISSLLLVLWLFLTLIKDIFTNIPNTVSILSDQPDVRWRYAAGMVISVFLRFMAIFFFYNAIQISQ